MSEPDWALAEPVSAPDEGEIHVWLGSLEAPADRIAQIASTLSAEEQARIARFRFQRERRRYTVRRATLRMLLGTFLDTPPRTIRFAYGAHGKPSIATPASGARLRFNLSDADDLALYAFTLDRELGVDIEGVRAMPDASDIAERFFSAAEYAVFQSVPTAKQPDAFFNCWTRKEAFVKAIGDGLTCPLDCFEVSLLPGEPAVMLRMRDDDGGASRWTFWHLEPLPGYVGAVTVEARDLSVVCRRLAW
ncbi:MAG TPA: 4'-phosphopantetheinyl transferase superfamily protein [Gemmatimonadales bacterium]